MAGLPICRFPLAYGGPSCKIQTLPFPLPSIAPWGARLFSHCHLYNPVVVLSRHINSAATGFLCFMGKSVRGRSKVSDHLFFPGEAEGEAMVDAHRVRRWRWKVEHLLVRIWRRGRSMLIGDGKLQSGKWWYITLISFHSCTFPYNRSRLEAGYSLNKLLKDFINRYKAKRGYRVKSVSGFLLPPCPHTLQSWPCVLIHRFWLLLSTEYIGIYRDGTVMACRSNIKR